MRKYAIIKKGATIILLLLVVFVGTILITETNYDYDQVLNIFYFSWLFAIVAGGVDSFCQTRFRKLLDYSLGVTRKKSFRNYLARIITTSITVLLIGLTNIIARDLVLDLPFGIFTFLHQQALILLISVYFCSCFCGCLLGYTKIKDYYVLAIYGILFVVLFLVKDYQIDYIGIILIVIDIALFFLVRYFKYNHQIA